MYYDLKESGKRIADLRKQKGFRTQETFAEALGLGASSISSIESGRKGCSIDTLIQIAELLETDIDYLVTGRKADSELNEILKTLSEERKQLALKILKGILENI